MPPLRLVSGRQYGELVINMSARNHYVVSEDAIGVVRASLSCGLRQDGKGNAVYLLQRFSAPTPFHIYIWLTGIHTGLTRPHGFVWCLDVLARFDVSISNVGRSRLQSVLGIVGTKAFWIWMSEVVFCWWIFREIAQIWGPVLAETVAIVGVVGLTRNVKHAHMMPSSGRWYKRDRTGRRTLVPVALRSVAGGEAGSVRAGHDRRDPSTRRPPWTSDNARLELAVTALLDAGMRLKEIAHGVALARGHAIQSALGPTHLWLELEVIVNVVVDSLTWPPRRRSLAPQRPNCPGRPGSTRPW